MACGIGAESHAAKNNLALALFGLVDTVAKVTARGCVYRTSGVITYAVRTPNGTKTDPCFRAITRGSLLTITSEALEAMMWFTGFYHLFGE